MQRVLHVERDYTDSINRLLGGTFDYDKAHRSFQHLQLLRAAVESSTFADPRDLSDIFDASFREVPVTPEGRQGRAVGARAAFGRTMDRARAPSIAAKRTVKREPWQAFPAVLEPALPPRISLPRRKSNAVVQTRAERTTGSVATNTSIRERQVAAVAVGTSAAPATPQSHHAGATPASSSLSSSSPVSASAAVDHRHSEALPRARAVGRALAEARQDWVGGAEVNIRGAPAPHGGVRKEEETITYHAFMETEIEVRGGEGQSEAGARPSRSPSVSSSLLDGVAEGLAKAYLASLAPGGQAVQTATAASGRTPAPAARPAITERAPSPMTPQRWQLPAAASPRPVTPPLVEVITTTTSMTSPVAGTAVVTATAATTTSPAPTRNVASVAVGSTPSLAPAPPRTPAQTIPAFALNPAPAPARDMASSPMVVAERPSPRPAAGDVSAILPSLSDASRIFDDFMLRMPRQQAQPQQQQQQPQHTSIVIVTAPQQPSQPQQPIRVRASSPSSSSTSSTSNNNSSNTSNTSNTSSSFSPSGSHSITYSTIEEKTPKGAPTDQPVVRREYTWERTVTGPTWLAAAGPSAPSSSAAMSSSSPSLQRGQVPAEGVWRSEPYGGVQVTVETRPAPPANHHHQATTPPTRPSRIPVLSASESLAVTEVSPGAVNTNPGNSTSSSSSASAEMIYYDSTDLESLLDVATPDNASEDFSDGEMDLDDDYNLTAAEIIASSSRSAGEIDQPTNSFSEGEILTRI